MGNPGIAWCLVLLCRKICGLAVSWQQGHLGMARASSGAMRMREVAMEFWTWRSGRIGGALWSRLDPSGHGLDALEIAGQQQTGAIAAKRG